MSFFKRNFLNITKLTQNHTLIVFTRYGLMFDRIFQNNINNKVFVFTDKLKTFNLSKYYKNTDCILTKKFNNKNISKFYFDNIKKYKNKIFKKMIMHF